MKSVCRGNFEGTSLLELMFSSALISIALASTSQVVTNAHNQSESTWNQQIFESKAATLQKALDKRAVCRCALVRNEAPNTAVERSFNVGENKTFPITKIQLHTDLNNCDAVQTGLFSVGEGKIAEIKLEDFQWINDTKYSAKAKMLFSDAGQSRELAIPVQFQTTTVGGTVTLKDCVF